MRVVPTGSAPVVDKPFDEQSGHFCVRRDSGVRLQDRGVRLHLVVVPAPPIGVYVVPIGRPVRFVYMRGIFQVVQHDFRALVLPQVVQGKGKKRLAIRAQFLALRVQTDIHTLLNSRAQRGTRASTRA